MWRTGIERRALALAAALALSGCSAVGDDAGGGVGSDSDGGQPNDGGACTGLEVDGVCHAPVPLDRAARCARAATDVPTCTDRDGDCFMGACPADVPAALAALWADCDDASPDRAPGATELCNGLDDDCDGDTDEAFALGVACDDCGGGKTECAVGDPTTTACSTVAGQSAGAPPDAVELCDGADDDCDGVTDEACALARPGVEAGIACGDGLLAVEGEGALTHLAWDADGALVETPLHPGPVAFPACGPRGAAWLAVDAAAPCETPPDGATRCVGARLWTWTPGGEPAARTALAELGPPAVGEAEAFWHAVVGDRTVLHRAPLEAGTVEPFAMTLTLSDPTAPAAGALAARRWDNGQATVVLVDMETGAERLLSNGAGSAGAPTLSDAWVVWPLGDGAPSLWAVFRETWREGFQLSRADGAQQRPTLSGDRLVWFDGGTTPPSLRAMNLNTGRVTDAAAAPRDAAAWSLRGAQLIWMDAENRLRISTLDDAP